MKIEEGKFYKTRDGRKVGPMRVGSASERVWEKHRSVGMDAEWSFEGKVILGGPEGYGDLIAEWADGPAFTVGARVRRIAPCDLDLPKGFETVVEKVGVGGFIHHRDAAGDLRYRHSSEYEIISPAGPVRTVTRREVVEGSYGRIRVCPHLPNAVLVGFTDESDDWDFTSLTPTELKAAAAVLLELAGALEE